MARIPDGILGKLLGRAGGITGYVRNGQNIVRTSTNNVDDLKTPKRIAQRAKISLCNQFVKPFAGTGFFTKSFPSYGNTGTGFNRAMGVVLNLAITGTYPNISISYPHVLISKGPLPPAQNAAAVANSESDIAFSWENNSGNGTAKATDKAILLAYFPALQQIIFSMQTGTRADGAAVLKTGILKGNTAETWLGFLSSDEKDAADSIYTGSVDL